MLEYLEKLQEEDRDNLIKKRETQRNIMKDVAIANEVGVSSTYPGFTIYLGNLQHNTFASTSQCLQGLIGKLANLNCCS